MNEALAVGLFLAGSGVGFLIALRWAAGRSNAAASAERAQLETRLAAAEENARAARAQNESFGAQLNGLQEALRTEGGLRAAAEARNENLPKLEQTLREKEAVLEQLQAGLNKAGTDLTETRTALEKERETAAEKIALLKDVEAQLANTFKALSGEALHHNNKSFLELAKASLEKAGESAKGDLEKRQQAISEIIRPVRESLDKVDLKIAALETARAGAYEGLVTQVKSLHESQTQLRTETANLVKALRSPVIRGRWGEVQLKRVVEMAGMLAHCDFHEQPSVNTEEGRQRPDLVVHLPGGKSIVIDAKAPLEAYLAAIEAPDDATRQAKLVEHARQIRTHLTALSRKAYWEQFSPAPEFAVLFLPGESFFSAALEQDPSLIETGVDQRVILATPTTLIALLKAIAYGWQQQSVEQNARAINDLGRELYKRMADLAGHFSKLGKNLGAAVDSYNRAVGSLETRVLVSARRFKELEASHAGAELDEVLPIDQQPRALQAPELSDPEVAAGR